MGKERMMCVAYASLHADIVGGGERSLMELVENLPASIQPELIIPAEGELSRQAENMGVPVQLLPMPKLGLATPAAVLKWRSYLKVKSLDVVHANQSRAAFYAGCAAIGTDTKVLFHCRIAEPDGLMDRLLMHLSDAIVCNSKAVARRFTVFGGLLKVIYNGVARKGDVAGDKPLLPKDGRLILFVGRLSAEKQPQLALQVFEQLAADDETLHFAMVGGDDPGDPGFSASIRDMVSASPCASRIHMPGAVDRMDAWYRRATLLLLTSKHEGFGRVLVEAMAEGVVPVAFAVGGVPELFDDGDQGFLVTEGDVDMMNQRAKQLLYEDVMRLAMAERGSRQAEKFSVDAHVAAVETLYREMLSGR